jgi:Zinc finger, ZZ type
MKVSRLRIIKKTGIFYYCRNSAQQKSRMSDIIPVSVGRCDMCAHDVETGQGWHCKYCVDFHICNPCYQKAGVLNHPHRLTTQDEKAREEAEKKVRLRFSLFCFLLF